MAKIGLSRNWYFPLSFGVLRLSTRRANSGVIPRRRVSWGESMTKLIDRVRDAMSALVEAIGGATLPKPELIPIKVTVEKPQR